jgi:hypothetical protein
LKLFGFFAEKQGKNYAFDTEELSDSILKVCDTSSGSPNMNDVSDLVEETAKIV